MKVTVVVCLMLLLGASVLSASGVNDWSLTDSNSYVTDVPTLKDFVPLGIEFIKTENNELKWNGLKWRLSCFIMVGIGRTTQGNLFLFQLRIPHPVHGEGHNTNTDLFFINNKWHAFYTLYSPIYFDEGEKFEHPTVYCYGKDRSGNEYIGSISYKEKDREWIYKVTPIKGNGVNVEIKVHPRGTTYWMGKPEGPYIIHGAIFNKEDIDAWGGFWEIGPCEGKIEKPGVGKIEFTGNAIWDRAYHIVYYSDTAIGAAGAPLTFTCGYIYANDFQLTIGCAENPSPIVPPVPFQHQGRLSFPGRNLSFRFDNYELSDSGGLQPTKFYINGSYEEGEVNLEGNVYLFYPKKWGVGKGTWWDLNASRTWGRAFIRWNGRITLYDEVIEVNDAVGVFECTRYKGTIANISVSIERPKEKHLYIFDREICPTLKNTVIIGGIIIKANVLSTDEITRVEFYVDDNLKYNDTEQPYEWLWDEFAIGRHEIKVVAHDNKDNKAEDKIDVIIFNFGRRK